MVGFIEREVGPPVSLDLPGARAGLTISLGLCPACRRLARARRSLTPAPRSGPPRSGPSMARRG
nr:MAG TPA: hypothetical protein [Caudoviricetes sp.]